MPFKDPEDLKAYHKKYRERNREKVQASIKKWRSEHPDFNGYMRVTNRAYYAQNAARIRARNNARRRARIAERGY